MSKSPLLGLKVLSKEKLKLWVCFFRQLRNKKLSTLSAHVHKVLFCYYKSSKTFISRHNPFGEWKSTLTIKKYLLHFLRLTLWPEFFGIYPIESRSRNNPNWSFHPLSCLAWISREDAVAHCKKKLAVFPTPAGMSLIKLSLGGKNLIISVQGELVSDIPAGDGKTANHFLKCTLF